MNRIPIIEILTPERMKNLATLCLYIKGLPRGYNKFNMATYLNLSPRGIDTLGNGLIDLWWKLPVKMNDPKFFNECGTSACLAGHGPLAGILAKKGETWSDYVSRVFTGHSERTIMVDHLIEKGILFNWMFGPRHSSSPLAGAKRIAWVLEDRMMFDRNDPYSNPVLRQDAEVPQDYEPDWRLIEKLAGKTPATTPKPKRK